MLRAESYAHFHSFRPERLADGIQLINFNTEEIVLPFRYFRQTFHGCSKKEKRFLNGVVSEQAVAGDSFTGAYANFLIVHNPFFELIIFQIEDAWPNERRTNSFTGRFRNLLESDCPDYKGSCMSARHGEREKERKTFCTATVWNRLRARIPTRPMNLRHLVSPLT